MHAMGVYKMQLKPEQLHENQGTNYLVNAGVSIRLSWDKQGKRAKKQKSHMVQRHKVMPQSALPFSTWTPQKENAPAKRRSTSRPPRPTTGFASSSPVTS
jgi:hypothetical protein